MKSNSSLCHTKLDCKYYIVWIPKYRRKVLFGKLRNYLGDVFHKLVAQRERKILEGHLCVDHVHMYIAIPPKYSVSKVVEYIKGKSAIHIAREAEGRAKVFAGQSFWAHGYYVTTVGRDEKVIREYIRRQEHETKRMEQLKFRL
ncbi:IS200/IS605 family transposase [Desulfovibrio sp. Fe33]|uniref:IS200/IS605 family transposase n=1 Tax=Desulfovibrio sp. Fe33 TaxID=3020842 RepID=UPI00234D2FD6|nr:IS200/IS605 family transposase [Desulfovibrio sp. Fe33]